jgi:hypothetical protein
MLGFMGMPGTQIYATTDLALGTAGKPTRVFSVNYTSGGTASAVILRNGTAATDTIFVRLDGTINKGTTWSDPNGLLFPAGCFVDVDANTASCAVSFTQEV